MRTGQQGNVYQPHHLGKWNPRAPAYGRFWIEVVGGERKRTTISLGPCAAQWVARLRLREYIERAGFSLKQAFHANPVPGTTFLKQAEWWMESVSVNRRRPLKPATIFGWQHCLDRWILPHLGKKPLCDVGNREVRQFVEVLSAAGLAPKTIVNTVAVLKLVVASAVDEEGDQIYPRTWNHEFIQLPLVIKEKQNRPTITGTEISAVIKSVKERYVVLFALVAGTGLRIGEALAVRADDFDPTCRVLQYREVYGGGASKHRRLRTRFDSLISPSHWRKFCVDIT
jgi:integrase